MLVRQRPQQGHGGAACPGQVGQQVAGRPRGEPEPGAQGGQGVILRGGGDPSGVGPEGEALELGGDLAGVPGQALLGVPPAACGVPVEPLVLGDREQVVVGLVQGAADAGIHRALGRLPQEPGEREHLHRHRGEHPVHHAGAPRGGRQDVRGVDELLDRVLEPARAVLERRDALPEVPP